MAGTDSRLSAWVVSRDKNLRKLSGDDKKGNKEYDMQIPNLFLRFKAVRLITPSSLIIYRGPKVKNPDRLLLFGAKSEDGKDNAYLSLMTYDDIDKDGVCLFTELPWLNEIETLRFYERMLKRNEGSLRTGHYNWTRDRPYPLLDQRIEEFLEQDKSSLLRLT